jgi:hypothetical protein
MANESIVIVQLDGAEALFTLGDDDDIDTVENVDVEVVKGDGSRWSATFLSLAEIGRIMERWKTTGENHGGRFFQCHDLVIVNGGGIVGMVEVLNNLLESDELKNVLVRIE